MREAPVCEFPIPRECFPLDAVLSPGDRLLMRDGPAAGIYRVVVIADGLVTLRREE